MRAAAPRLPRHGSIELESIYAKLPISLQQLAVCWVGWRTRRTRYDDHFRRCLGAAIERDGWPADRLLAYRDGALRSAIAHAAATVPHYREVLAGRGLRPESVRSVDDLATLPLLTKQRVRELGSELESEQPPARRITTHTSGTTGTALHLGTSMAAVQEQWATFWRFCGRHGISLMTPCALFAGRSVVPASQTRPPFWRASPMTNQVVFSGYHMSSTTLPAYVEELRRRQPPWIHGYPSLIALVAGHLLETGFDLGYAPRAVTVSSETLQPHQRSLIERAFSVTPRRYYGNTEGVATIGECEQGGLHVDEDFAAVELLERNDAVEIVGTSLWNPAMPLIRYTTGDLTTAAGSCSCGRVSRVVGEIDGRIEDYVVLRDGTRLGRLDHIFKDMLNVREAQIYQPRAGEILLRIVPGSGFGPTDERALMAEATKRIGNRAQVAIEYRESLRRSAESKLRFVVSDVERQADGPVKTGRKDNE